MKKIKTAFLNLRRSPYQAIAAILLTGTTFFVITICAFFVGGTHLLLQFFESRPQVTAFFKDATTDAQINELKQQILDTGLSQSVKVVSKAEALKIYEAQNQNNPLLLEMVTADILPASLEVSGKSVADLGTLASKLKENPGVEEVVYQKDVIDTLKKWIDGLRLAGLCLSGLLLLASFLTIMVILGMRVAVRKNEITTLALLGASPWYIGLPFLYEGLIYTLSGVIIGFGAGYLLLLYLTPNLLAFFQGTPIFPLPVLPILYLLGGELAAGSLIGFVTSSLATRRYRK